MVKPMLILVWRLLILSFLLGLGKILLPAVGRLRGVLLQLLSRAVTEPDTPMATDLVLFAIS